MISSYCYWIYKYTYVLRNSRYIADWYINTKLCINSPIFLEIAWHFKRDYMSCVYMLIFFRCIKQNVSKFIITRLRFCIYCFCRIITFYLEISLHHPSSWQRKYDCKHLEKHCVNQVKNFLCTSYLTFYICDVLKWIIQTLQWIWELPVCKENFDTKHISCKLIISPSTQQKNNLLPRLWMTKIMACLDWEEMQTLG